MEGRGVGDGREGGGGKGFERGVWRWEWGVAETKGDG